MVSFNWNRGPSISDDVMIGKPSIYCRDVPIDMKYISEPHMHSMPAVTIHPNGKFTELWEVLPMESPCDISVEKWLACQSMDNQIMIYGVHNNFRLNRKKNFKGHMVSCCHGELLSSMSEAMNKRMSDITIELLGLSQLCYVMLLLVSLDPSR